MAAQIEVEGYDGPLFEGEAEFAETHSGEFDWQVDFVVPNYRIAQFQMRKGEQVIVALGEGQRLRAYVDAYFFESDSLHSAAGGHGRIRLVGRGPVPG